MSLALGLPRHIGRSALLTTACHILNESREIWRLLFQILSKGVVVRLLHKPLKTPEKHQPALIITHCWNVLLGCWEADMVANERHVQSNEITYRMLSW